MKRINVSKKKYLFRTVWVHSNENRKVAASLRKSGRVTRSTLWRIAPSKLFIASRNKEDVTPYNFQIAPMSPSYLKCLSMLRAVAPNPTRREWACRMFRGCTASPDMRDGSGTRNTASHANVTGHLQTRCQYMHREGRPSHILCVATFKYVFAPRLP